jgi:hypothetical protein
VPYSVVLVAATTESATGNLGAKHDSPYSVGLDCLALVGVLSAVLIGHLWDRCSQETEALGFSGIYERYLASQAGFGDDAQGYRAMSHAGMVHEASALEE